MANTVQTPTALGGNGGSSTPANDAGSSLTGTDLQHAVFWGSGAAALLIITDFYPKVGVALTGLIVAGVLLRFSGQVTSFVQGITASSTKSGGGPDEMKAGLNASGTGYQDATVGGHARVVALPQNGFLRATIRRGA